MGCDEVRRLRDAMLDGELSAAEARAVTAHIALCPACAAAQAADRAFQADLRRAVTYHRAPEALRRRLGAALAAAALTAPTPATPPLPAPAPSPAFRLPRRSWLALAASFALGIVVASGGTLVLERQGAADRLGEEVIADHLRALMPGHLTDVASTDQHTVKPWFAGRLDFSPPVEDLAGAGFPLVGGRLDYLAGRPVAALVYRRRQHLVNVFVAPANAVAAPAAARLTYQGYHLVHWQAGGMAFWAVSDVDPAELTELERLLRAAAGAGGGG